MRDIYFGMRWVENELRWEIHNLVYNKQGCDVRQTWIFVRNEQVQSRTEPMKSNDCRKAGKQSCMGKYRFDISGWIVDDCEKIHKLWDGNKWISTKGWRYQVSKSKTVRSWSNAYYGGVYSIVNITLGKEYVEVGRFIFDFLCETDCLLYHRTGKKKGVMVGKIWDVMKEDYCIIDVVGWNRFQLWMKIDPAWDEDDVGSVLPIWKVLLENKMKGYTNVEWKMDIDTEHLLIEWEVK
jgi:hypothetical protein